MKCGIIIPAKIQGFELLRVNCNSLPRPSWELYQTVSKVYLTSGILKMDLAESQGHSKSSFELLPGMALYLLVCARIHLGTVLSLLKCKSFMRVGKN